MPLVDRDRLLRQVRALQQLLVRAKKSLAGQEFESALAELHRGYREVLGLPYELLSQLHSSSAVLMLGTTERRAAYQEILRAEAEVLEAQGNSEAVRAVQRRLAELTQAGAPS
jgi:hypothetical protein